MNDLPSDSHPASQSEAKPWEHAKPGQGSAQDPLATRFVQSLSYDRRLYKHDIIGSIAHARMLRHIELLTDDELKQIEEGLGQIKQEIEAAHSSSTNPLGWHGWKPHLEDVHMCIEAALIEKIGDVGRKLHTGRSRNDQVALDLKLWVQEAAGQLHSRFNTLFKALVDLAQRDGMIVMPSYTHLQRAQPIVVGGELIAWLSAFDRADQRLAALFSVNDENPLGCGAIAGSALPLDRDHTAAALGLGKPTPSSIDATSSRDIAIDFVYALAMTSMNLSRWAGQWILYASTEFSFIRLDDRYTTGSSMMPQKSNPDMLELIRGRCGGVYGHLIALLNICNGLGIGYSRDLQEDKRHVFDAFDCVADCLDMAAKIIDTTRFNEAIITQGLERGYLDATSLAEYLVTKGVPFRTAHQIVGSLVKRCSTQKLEKLSELTVRDFNLACAEVGAADNTCDSDVFDWLGPGNVVGRYRTYGNAGRSGFQDQIKVWKSRLGDG